MPRGESRQPPPPRPPLPPPPEALAPLDDGGGKEEMEKEEDDDDDEDEDAEASSAAAGARRIEKRRRRRRRMMKRPQKKIAVAVSICPLIAAQPSPVSTAWGTRAAPAASRLRRRLLLRMQLFRQQTPPHPHHSLRKARRSLPPAWPKRPHLGSSCRIPSTPQTLRATIKVPCVGELHRHGSPAHVTGITAGSTGALNIAAFRGFLNSGNSLD